MKKLFCLLTALVAFNAMSAFAYENSEVAAPEQTTEVVVADETPAEAETETAAE